MKLTRIGSARDCGHTVLIPEVALVAGDGEFANGAAEWSWHDNRVEVVVNDVKGEAGKSRYNYHLTLTPKDIRRILDALSQCVVEGDIGETASAMIGAEKVLIQMLALANDYRPQAS